MNAELDGRRVVPGLPGYLQLLAPEQWDRYEITINSAPPSLNTNEIRSHWTGFHKKKKEWEELIQTELMVAGVPRGGQRAMAGVSLRLPNRRRRDSGNFGALLEKALGDALTFSGDPHRPANLRYIADDDAARFYFAGVEFDGERGHAKTTIVLFIQPEEC